MGLEAKTIATIGRKRYEGKLHLDSKSLTFKSQDFKWAALLGDPILAQASNNRLIVEQGGEKVSFEVGSTSNKWVEKILNPPNRLKKLGVKPDHKLWLSKGFSKSFTDELKQQGSTFTRQLEKCELAFWKVTNREELIEFHDLAERLPDSVNIWIVWPKGSKTIGQTEVMTLAKQLGFGPSKTAAFDDDHSSMRFARKK